MARSVIGEIETGRLDWLRVDVLIRVVAALGGRVDFMVRWQGGDLDRLMNARHGALHESVARWFLRSDGWTIAPEVSFNIRGERGVIDILAWHGATRTLLVIELKTEIVDVSEAMGTLDKKTRLARPIARERGWDPLQVGVWLVVADSAMNRRRVRAHRTTLRAALPADGRSVAGWLARPEGALRCLSFWTNSAGGSTKSRLAAVKRVRRPASRSFGA